jgi:hypothetical protein
MSIEKIWYRLANDSNKEMKRAFVIWKEKKMYEKHSLQILRRVTKKRNLRRLDEAMNTWGRYSKELEYHCRIRLLHREFTRKAYLSHCFHELKGCVRVER